MIKVVFRVLKSGKNKQILAVFSEEKYAKTFAKRVKAFTTIQKVVLDDEGKEILR